MGVIPLVGGLPQGLSQDRDLAELRLNRGNSIAKRGGLRGLFRRKALSRVACSLQGLERQSRVAGLLLRVRQLLPQSGLQGDIFVDGLRPRLGDVCYLPLDRKSV